MEYSLTISTLLGRPAIRDDQAFEFLNRMTDKEIDQWDSETMEMLREEQVQEVFPDWNSAYLAKCVDRQILFELFLLGNGTKTVSTNN